MLVYKKLHRWALEVHGVSRQIGVEVEVEKDVEVAVEEAAREAIEKEVAFHVLRECMTLNVHLTLGPRF